MRTWSLMCLYETETHQNQTKQPRYQPTGAITVGWALDHFPYHPTLLKIAVHRSRVLSRHKQEQEWSLADSHKNDAVHLAVWAKLL